VNARERLIEAFAQDNWSNPLFSREKYEAWVSAVLAQHAHELAEEIRSESPYASGDGIFPTEWEEGLIYGADLIDPKVEK